MFHADRFRQLAAAKGAKTYEASADLCGLDRGSLYRIVNGRRVPHVDLALQIAISVGSTVEDLWSAAV